MDTGSITSSRGECSAFPLPFQLLLCLQTDFNIFNDDNIRPVALNILESEIITKLLIPWHYY